MPLLKQLIPQQKFEIVRDRIAEILMDELNAQGFIHGNPKWVPKAVCIERTIAFDKAVMPIINVSVSNGAYTNKDITQVDGSYQFFVDVYANSPSKEQGKGDTLAAMDMHRIVGMCRAILENPAYCTLGFEAPFNNSIKVLSISFGDTTEQDALPTAVGRLIVEVVIPETVELSVPRSNAITKTQALLYNTTLGYLYTTEEIIRRGVFTIQFTNQFS